MEEETFYIATNTYSLRQRKTKRGIVYDAIFRIIDSDGVERQKVLSGFDTKSAAKKAYMDFTRDNCELANRSQIQKAKTQKASNPLVSDAIEEYLQSIVHINKDSTVYDKRNTFHTVIAPLFGNCKLKDLTVARMSQFQTELCQLKKKDGSYISYSYMRKLRGFTSDFLSWATAHYGMANNFLLVKPPKRRIAPKRDAIWTREQFERFLSVVDDPLYRTMFAVLFYTGRRKGEVTALTPDDVTENEIRFNKTYTRRTIDGKPYNITSTKNERDGKTKICNSLKKELALYTPQSPFFFGGEKPIPETTLSRAFKKYTALAGLPPIRIHDLRHSFVSMLIHNGASVFSVAALIGDTVEQVQETYGHFYEDDVSNLLQQI